MAQDFDYLELDSLLIANNAVMSVAEAHGVLSGMLCMEIQAGLDQWLAEVFDNKEENLYALDLEILTSVFEQTRAALSDGGFEFALVIPDDEVDLDQRSLALSEWAGGFLCGLGYGGDQSQWSGDGNEILRDIVEISRLDPDAEGEENEQAFTELNEYLRVAVQLIQSEIQDSSKQSRSLH